MAIAASSQDYRSNIGVAASQWRLRGTLVSAGWLTIAQIAAGSAAFVVSMMRARSLTLEQFGVYALAATLVALFSILADLGLSVMMVRDLARDGLNMRRYLSAALFLTVALASVAGLAVITIGAILGGGDLVVLCAVLALNMVLVGAGMTPIAYLRATGRAWGDAASRLVSGFILVVLSLLVIVLHGGVMAFAWAVVAGTTTGLLPPLVVMLRGAGLCAPRIDLPHWRALVADSAPLGAAMLCTAVYYYADGIMLGAFGQRVALARYNASYVFVMAAVLIIGAVRNAFVPAQSRAFAGETPVAPVLAAYFRVSAALALPMFIVAPVAAPLALRIAYGESYVAAAPALRILFITTGVMFFSSYFGSNLFVSGRQRFYLVATGVGAAVNVALNIALIPLYSIVGASIATLAAECAVCALLAYENRPWPVWQLPRVAGRHVSSPGVADR